MRSETEGAIAKWNPHAITLAHSKTVATCCADQSIEQALTLTERESLQTHIDRWAANLPEEYQQKVEHLIQKHAAIWYFIIAIWYFIIAFWYFIIAFVSISLSH